MLLNKPLPSQKKTTSIDQISRLNLNRSVVSPLTCMAMLNRCW